MTDPLHGQRVLVMGLGRFGGGAGVARFAARAGATVTVTDAAEAGRLGEGVAQIADLVESGRVTLRLGGHDEADLDRCDLLVVNPAVPKPWENPYVRAARARGVAVTTEIAMLFERLGDRPIIGITGTLGKSTTAAMIHRAVEASGVPCALGGNIGGSLLNDLDRLDPHAVVVVELSSAMLWWLGEAGAMRPPSVAVVTGFEPNHVDWHGSVEHYGASKRLILGGQAAGDHAVLGDGVADWSTAPGVARHGPWGGDLPEMALPGAHNRGNARLAVAAASALGLDPGGSARAIAGFGGLPHRLEFLGERRGVLCYNDSKSSTPGATLIAVRAVLERARGVHLIAGGADKGVDLSPIARLDLAGLYTIGRTGPAIAAAAGGGAVECGTVDEAVRAAAGRAQPGEAILLSPGCASWDQFEHFGKRGERFVALIEEHMGERG